MERALTFRRPLSCPEKATQADRQTSRGDNRGGNAPYTFDD